MWCREAKEVQGGAGRCREVQQAGQSRQRRQDLRWECMDLSQNLLFPDGKLLVCFLLQIFVHLSS